MNNTVEDVVYPDDDLEVGVDTGASLFDLEDDYDDDSDDGFDAEAEFDAMPADDVLFDGDFVGHPFRGNQYVSQHGASSSAVHASRRAKKAMSSGNKREMRAAHKAAYHAHEAAASMSSGSTKAYHKKMARMHHRKSI